jgi:hypothetical protein
MFLNKKIIASVFLFNCFSVSAEIDYDISGSFALESRFFTQDSLEDTGVDRQLSLFFSPRIDAHFENTTISFQPIIRHYSENESINYTDVRELMVYNYVDNFEFNFGIGRVFWGQTESLHLVDIINQTDILASIDEEEKMGQQMVNINYISEKGKFSFFILPSFEERGFNNELGRLSPQIRIDKNNVLYESSEKETHIDYAFRWESSFEYMDVGLSYFNGTSRLPNLNIVLDINNEFNLISLYNQLSQFSIDSLIVLGSTSLKIEAIYGEILDENFYAYVAGFEHTFFDIFNSGYNLGLLSEYQFDERVNNPLIIGQDDLMIGSRLEINDFSGTEFIFAYVKDLEYGDSYSAYIEGSTRINDSIRVTLNAYIFDSNNIEDPIYQTRQDDHIELNIEYFF